MKNRTTAVLLTLCFLATLSFSACDNGYADNTGSYENARLTLKEQESLYPTSFIKSDGTYRRNLIGEWVMEGSVTSKATVANYKDVVLNISYYSKTNTLIGSEQHTLYEYLAPGSTVQFKIKSFGYKGTSGIGVEVEDAVISN